jgi:hypothetical protein
MSTLEKRARAKFRGQLKKIYGRDAKAFGELLVATDFDLLKPSDYKQIKEKHLDYVDPKWKLKTHGWDARQGSYKVEQYKELFYKKYFLSELKRTRQEMNIDLFKQLMEEFFQTVYPSFSCMDVVAEFEKQLANSSSGYLTAALRQTYQLLKFRSDLAKTKGSDAKRFVELLKSMDFSLLENGEGGDMQEIEINYFGCAKDWGVHPYEKFYLHKLKAAGQLSWTEYIKWISKIRERRRGDI